MGESCHAERFDTNLTTALCAIHLRKKEHIGTHTVADKIKYITRFAERQNGCQQ